MSQWVVTDKHSQWSNSGPMKSNCKKTKNKLRNEEIKNYIDNQPSYDWEVKIIKIIFRKTIAASTWTRGKTACWKILWIGAGAVCQGVCQSLGERQVIWRSQITTLDVLGNLDFTNQIIWAEEECIPINTSRHPLHCWSSPENTWVQLTEIGADS